MWERELFKVVPAPDIYNVSKELGKVEPNKERCTFGRGYESYKKVCIIIYSFLNHYLFYRRVILIT